MFEYLSSDVLQYLLQFMHWHSLQELKCCSKFTYKACRIEIRNKNRYTQIPLPDCENFDDAYKILGKMSYDGIMHSGYGRSLSIVLKAIELRAVKVVIIRLRTPNRFDEKKIRFYFDILDYTCDIEINNEYYNREGCEFRVAYVRLDGSKYQTDIPTLPKFPHSTISKDRRVSSISIIEPPPAHHNGNTTFPLIETIEYPITCLDIETLGDYTRDYIDLFLYTIRNPKNWRTKQVRITFRTSPGQYNRYMCKCITRNVLEQD